MPVDPIELKLKLPGTKRLKLKCDTLHSTFAFNFNLHRYTEGQPETVLTMFDLRGFSMVRRCRLTLSKPALKAPGIKRLKPSDENLLSKFENLLSKLLSISTCAATPWPTPTSRSSSFSSRVSYRISRSASARQGGIEKKLSTDVESPPPLPRVCKSIHPEGQSCSDMTKCVKPLRHLATSSNKSSRSTNQNAPFGRLSTKAHLTKCLSGLAHLVISD